MDIDNDIENNNVYKIVRKGKTNRISKIDIYIHLLKV